MQLRLRVTVSDTWTTVPLTAAEEETVGAVKARALDAAGIDPGRHQLYEVKVGGALIAEEFRTLGAVGIGDGASLVVIAKRRRPVR